MLILDHEHYPRMNSACEVSKSKSFTTSSKSSTKSSN